MSNKPNKLDINQYRDAIIASKITDVGEIFRLITAIESDKEPILDNPDTFPLIVFLRSQIATVDSSLLLNALIEILPEAKGLIEKEKVIDNLVSLNKISIEGDFQLNEKQIRQIMNIAVDRLALVETNQLDNITYATIIIKNDRIKVAIYYPNCSAFEAEAKTFGINPENLKQ